MAYCRDVLGLSRSVAVEDPLQRVWVQFVHDDHGLCYELVSLASEESPVAQVLKTRRNVITTLPIVREQPAGERRTATHTQRHLPLGPASQRSLLGSHVQFFLSPLGHIVELIEGVE